MSEARTTPADHARHALSLGIRPIPVPQGSKNPGRARWPAERLDHGDIDTAFPVDLPLNVGLLWGEPSGGIVDVDLDHPLAIALADDVLPPTGLIFGRASKSRSHRLYRVSAPIETRRLRLDAGPAVVEIRSTGSHTIGPGSIHPDGERIEWDEEGPIGEIDPDALIRAVAELADRVRANAGEPPAGTPPSAAAAPEPEDRDWHTDAETLRRGTAYVGHMPPGISGEGGHDRTYAAATALVHGFCIPPDAALTILEAHFNPRCDPPWSRDELRHKVDDAAIKPHDRPFGWLRGAEEADSMQPPNDHDDRNEIDPDRVAYGSFELVSIAEIGPAEEPAWVWPGYLARGYITLLTGLWKAGKTTLLTHLLRDLGRGAGLVDAPMGSMIFLVSEETDGMWARRRDDLELPRSVQLVKRPSFRRPNAAEWVTFVSDLVRAVRDHQPALVVLDTLPSAWPVLNENDAGESLTALTPLRDLAAIGCAVLLVCHPRKGDGTEAQATRGSGALTGFVDIIVELRRHDPTSQTDNRRVLRAYSRFDSTPREQVIELAEGGYRMLGARTEVNATDVTALIMEVLASDASDHGLTADEIRAKWPRKPAIGKTQLGERLNAGAANESWIRSGSGVRGDPFRFRRADPSVPPIDVIQPPRDQTDRNESTPAPAA